MLLLTGLIISDRFIINFCLQCAKEFLNTFPKKEKLSYNRVFLYSDKKKVTHPFISKFNKMAF